MGVLRISTHNISVQPQSKTIKYVGAHLHPFFLAYLTEQPVNKLPWLVNIKSISPKIASQFSEQIDECQSPEEMFVKIEKIFLDNLLVRDLPLITSAVKVITESFGKMSIKDLAKQLSVSERTIRNHFNQYVGCSPKDYSSLVRLKQTAFELMHSNNSLTSIAHDNNYFDQSHFIHDVKNITGKTPKNLKKELPNFRFLQF